jgi:Circularly permuted ATP-grasp type 2
LNSPAVIFGDNSIMNPAPHSAQANASQPPWPLIERALLQRVRLMELVAQDVYGAQAMLQRGAVPAALTWGHSAWQPCLHQIQPLGQRWLGMVSFEVGQDAQGQCWVLRSSTSDWRGWTQPWVHQPPSALPPDWLAHWGSACQVSPGETAQWVTMSSSCDPDGRTDSGGVWRAHPSQLQVRSGRLWAQRPEGWRPVHGLICETEMDASDPLESTHTNPGWLAGLFSCIRQGTLAVVNMPGLGFLDEAAWAAFWPSLCLQCLGEPLTLPSPASWWLGEDQARPQAHSLTGAAWLWPHDAEPAEQPAAAAIWLRPGDEAARQAAWASALARPEGWTLQQSLKLEAAWRVWVLCGQGGPEGIAQIEPWFSAHQGVGP